MAVKLLDQVVVFHPGREPLARQIVASRRNDMPHPSAGVGHIPTIAGDHVDVQMVHRLPGSLARVPTDVEAVRRISLQDFVACGLERIQELSLLGCTGGEPISHMASRDQQGVTRRNRVSIPEAQHALSPVKHSLRGRVAERAMAHSTTIGTRH